MEKNNLKVFINPGHCQPMDPGAVRELEIDGKKESLIEADINLQIGKILTKLLENDGFNVIMEQSDNIHGERASRTKDPQLFEDSIVYHANKNQCNIFISLHCDAFGSNNAYGTTVFYHPGSVNGSRLANDIQSEICNQLNMEWRDQNTEKAKDLWVLTDTNMPAILVEMGFLSNINDGRKLLYKQNEFAKAMKDGICKYFGVA